MHFGNKMLQQSNIHLSNLITETANRRVYQLHFELLPNDTMQVTARFWEGANVKCETVNQLSKWEHKSLMWCGYLSNAYRVPANNSSIIQSASQFIGEQIWTGIHGGNANPKPWMQFRQSVEQQSTDMAFSDCLVLSGSDLRLPVPFECVSQTEDPGAFLHAHQIPVFRKKTLTNDPGSVDFSFLDAKLPEEVVILFGDDHMDKPSLDYKGEIRNWYGILRPNTQLRNELVDRAYGLGDAITSEFGQCRINLVPRGDLGHLERVLAENCSSRPFVFMYIGHGFYEGHNSHHDGKLRFRPSPQSPQSLTDLDSQESLIGLLTPHNPVAILLNSCEGIRNIEFPPYTRVEDRYFTSLASLELLGGYRSEVLDNSAKRISSQLLKSIQARHSVSTFLGELMNLEYQQTAIKAELLDKTTRDYVSRVALFR